MKPKHLKNAPITEALLDLRVKWPPSMTLSGLEALHRRIEGEYPTKRKRTHYQAQLNADDPASSSQHVSDFGYIFWSEDGKRAVQARLDGYAFSQLAPYGTWEELRDEARRLWSVFCTEAEPTRITRVALRYINRLPLPLPIRFQDYLLTFPQIGPAGLSTVSGLLMRIVAPTEDGATVSVTEAIEEHGVTSDTIPVILDIDVFKPLDLPIARQDECWRDLEAFRDLKNRVFFESITEKTGDLFS